MGRFQLPVGVAGQYNAVGHDVSFCCPDSGLCAVVDSGDHGLLEDPHAEIVCGASLPDAQVQGVNMTVAVAHERAVIEISAEHVAGLAAVPELIAMRKTRAFALVKILFENSELPGLQGNLGETVFEVTIDRVFFDALPNEVVTTPANLLERLSGLFAILAAHLLETRHAVDDLPAIASGRTPAHTVGLEQCDREAALGKCERCRYTGEACANDTNVGRVRAL